MFEHLKKQSLSMIYDNDNQTMNNVEDRETHVQQLHTFQQLFTAMIALSIRFKLEIDDL